MLNHSRRKVENMNAVPYSYRSNLFSYRSNLFAFVFVFVLPLSGCMGRTGGSGGLADKSNASVSVSASTISVTDGQPVTLEAYINPSLATGTVTFYDGSNAIGTATI